MKYAKQEYDKYMDLKYEDEIKNISEEDLQIINKVIDLAKEKIGLQYIWGGKGEIITEERLNELISDYGESYYQLLMHSYRKYFHYIIHVHMRVVQVL